MIIMSVVYIKIIRFYFYISRRKFGSRKQIPLSEPAIEGGPGHGQTTQTTQGSEKKRKLIEIQISPYEKRLIFKSVAITFCYILCW